MEKKNKKPWEATIVNEWTDPLRMPTDLECVADLLEHVEEGRDGEKLKRMREDARLTQDELAELLFPNAPKTVWNVTLQRDMPFTQGWLIDQWERGDWARVIPEYDTPEKRAAVLQRAAEVIDELS